MAKYIAKLNYRYDYKDKDVTAEMTINLDRFEGQFAKAQYEIDSTIMTDMVPFMPMQTGQFVNVTRAMSAAIAGSGKVVAAAPPFGRFLYEGKVMVGERSRSPWAKPAERKVVTSRNIQFYTGRHPEAQAHWFDPAKKKNIKKWVAKAKKAAGGGAR